MQTVYFDWSIKHGITYMFEEDQPPFGPLDEIHQIATIDDLLNQLKEPTTLICESTFESFEVAKRKALVEQVSQLGHVWKVMPTRQTPRMRKELGIEDKNDFVDVYAIRHFARTRPDGLKAPSVHNDTDPRVEAAARANDELMKLRRTYTQIPAPRSRLGVKFVSRKEKYSEKIIDQLPEPDSLTDLQRRVFLKKTGEYRGPLVAAVAVAVRHTTSRADFEHLLGMYANGYPSQFRSDIHWWTYRYLRNDDICTMSEFRKAVRQLRSMMKGLDLSVD